MTNWNTSWLVLGGVYRNICDLCKRSEVTKEFRLLSDAANSKTAAPGRETEGPRYKRGKYYKHYKSNLILVYSAH